MIVVVEGISAAGKTTWCNQAASASLLPESFPADRKSQPVQDEQVAAYWTRWNAKRWSDVCAIEQLYAVAVCDTDPLKLHYSWCLWQVGQGTEAQWQLAWQAARRAVAAQQLGFADLYLVKAIDAATARQQMAGDPGRTRKNFELHLSLQAPLLDWYRAIEQVFPGRVLWHLPLDFKIPQTSANTRRYDLRAFDALLDALPRPAFDLAR